MVRRICEITVTLDFIFRLVLCSGEYVSFNSICLNVLEGIKFYLLHVIWFKITRLETPFKGDNVTLALIKTSNCENLVLYFSEKEKIAAFAMLFGFQ